MIECNFTQVTSFPVHQITSIQTYLDLSFSDILTEHEADC